MAPVSLNVRARRSQGSIRTVSLTPPGVSTNYIMNHIIDDLVDGCLQGFKCVDAFGKTVHCFFKVTGFIADYPASSAILNLTGHTSFAPCTHCAFYFNRWAHSSKYSYSSSITSRNSTFMRTQHRTHSIRSSRLSKTEAQFLGMSLGDENMLHHDGFSPLLKFCAKHNELLASSPGIHNLESHELDGYSLNIVAPDHLITGLMKGVLLCSFIQLDDEHKRTHLQLRL